MPGHKHDSSAGTQNQGNTLGDRACVRQSKLYRMHESGNDIKSILGTPHLCWDTRQKQGAYEGHAVYDHTLENPLGMDSKYQQNRRRSYEGAGGAPFARDEGSGSSNYGTTSGGYGSRKANDDYDYEPAASNARGRGAYDQEPDNGYGGYAPAPTSKKYSNSNHDTAYRTGLGGNYDETGPSNAASRNSLGNYSQATRRQKQLEDLPPNPYARRDNDENVGGSGNSYRNDGGSYSLSQMRDVKQQMDGSAYSRGGSGSANSSSLSAYANSRAARDDRSTRPW